MKTHETRQFLTHPEQGGVLPQSPGHPLRCGGNMQIGQGDARMSVLILYFLGHGEARDHPGDSGAVKWQGWPRVGWAGCVQGIS